jgi:sigma54-dependent transcription regulator
MPWNTGPTSRGIMARHDMESAKANWIEVHYDDMSELLSAEQLAQVDAFDRLQLQSVIEVCRRSRSIADAGRALFGASRTKRCTINDSDRLHKYLARFGGPDWSTGKC